jgi:hypothetical protein
MKSMRLDMQGNYIKREKEEMWYAWKSNESVVGGRKEKGIVMHRSEIKGINS